MNLFESIRVALEGIWVNKMRAFLTMLGIIIGVAAVIAVVAIGQGGKQQVVGEFEKIGANTFGVSVRSMMGNSSGAGEKEKLTLRDVELIKRNVLAVKKVAPVNYNIARGAYKKKKEDLVIIGSTPAGAEIMGKKYVKGKPMSDTDVAARRRVIVLEERLAEKLFDESNPLGKVIKINNKPFTVIGVTESSSSALSKLQPPEAYIPITSWRYLYTDNAINQIECQAVSKERLQEAMDQTKRVIEKAHGAKDAYQVQSFDQQMDAANKVLNILTMIISAIAGISLFVGGIGVMNIMLVSVTERTREIGIRKALGARRRDILIQFLIESVMLCLIGGAIGMLLGIGGAQLAAKALKFPPLVSWSTVLIAITFSSAVGIFFGIYPANKASKMDPIEALRYE